MTATPHDVLTFWYGDDTATGFDNAKMWFMGGKAADDAIIERFAELISLASAGHLRHWDTTPLGRLAQIIVLDQFSRNAYRGTALAFANDALTRRIVLDGLDLAHDRALSPAGRIFFIMPLMHAEDLPNHDLCIDAFTRLAAETSEPAHGHAINSLEYAKKHRSIILRFGRYPHRNAVLGRVSTPEELVFLEDPSTRFGQ